MAEQNNLVDFLNGGDTGEDTLESIQPMLHGEPATHTNLRRPTENIRSRTEIVRDEIEALKYYRDYGKLLLEYSGGTVTWNGPGPGASPLGEITITGGTFKISPFLAPSVAKKGSLSVGTPASNQITYTVASTAYATQGMNSVTVRHLNGGAATPLAVTITDGPIKRIIVIFDSANTAHDAAAVKAAVDVAVAADTDLAGKIVTTTSAVAAVTIAAVAETRIEGTADDESHWVSGADVEALTVATPLEPGMGIAIWYRYLIEPSTPFGGDPKAGLAGGRAESSISRTTNVIPAAALFITDENPEKIPGAIPFCRVGYNGQLIFFDGTKLETGESTSFLSAVEQVTANLSAATGASLVGYNGSGNWADSTAVAAGTVESAIDEVVSDLAGTSGAAKVGFTTASVWKNGDTIAAAAVAAAISEVVDELADATGVGANGASRVGFAPQGALTSDNVEDAIVEAVDSSKNSITIASLWKDGSGIAATNVQAAVAEIVDDLADATGVGANGASRVGFAPQGALTSDNVEDAIVEAADSSKNSITIASLWKDGSGVVATNVQAAVAEVVTDLADAVGTGANGASRVGIAPQTYVVADNVEGAIVEAAGWRNRAYNFVDSTGTANNTDFVFYSNVSSVPYSYGGGLGFNTQGINIITPGHYLISVTFLLTASDLTDPRAFVISVREDASPILTLNTWRPTANAADTVTLSGFCHFELTAGTSQITVRNLSGVTVDRVLDACRLDVTRLF